jgi:hypothetical protein
MPATSLPDDFVESVAIVNAASIGEQPAILANLALANQIFNNNLEQQILISQQQAMNQIMLATLGKCVTLILRDDGVAPYQSGDMKAVLDEMRLVLVAAREMLGQLQWKNPAPAPAAGTAAQSPTGPGEPAASNLDPNAVNAIALANLKSIAEQPAMLSNLAYANTVANTNMAQQNSVSNQQALNELGVAILGKTVSLISNAEPTDAKGDAEMMSGNKVAEAIAELKASARAAETA